MRPSQVSVAVTAVFFGLACLCSIATAQILGCDGLDCRTSDNPNVLCPLTDDGVGTATFDSNITADGPLTWTVAGTTDPYVGDDAPKGASRIAKNFYLSTPPSVQFTTASNFRGCSFVYFDITSALQTPAGFNDFANFGCDTVLGNQCTDDLLSQVRDEISQRALTSDNTACVSAMEALQQRPIPESCNINSTKTSWGYIDVGQVAYDNVTSPSIQQADCDITGQGPSYNLAFTNIASRDLDPESLDAELWRNGTTPVVTVFFNGAGDDNPALVDPEYHLTCLRTVPSTEVQGSASLVSRRVGMSLVVLGVFGAFLLF